jgi:hypothetical protein
MLLAHPALAIVRDLVLLATPHVLARRRATAVMRFEP